MKIILDPLIFVFDEQANKSDQFENVKLALDQINLIIDEYRGRVTLERTDWLNFRSKYIAPFLLFFNNTGLTVAWRKIEQTFVPSVPPNVPRITSWGTTQLFGASTLGTDPWVNVISTTAVASILANERIIFFYKKIVGRNFLPVGAGNAVLGVKTRWCLYFSAQGTPGAAPVDCVSSLRNLRVPWTIRYDDRLPAIAPNGGLAFEPHPDWRKGKVAAYGTSNSKAVWYDVYGNGWAKPSPPNLAHHWDVYLNDTKTAKRFPINPINITCWNTKDRGKSEGELHHTQAGQQHVIGKLK